MTKGGIVSLTKLTEEELVFPKESLTYNLIVLLPSFIEIEETLFPQVIVVFVKPLLREYLQACKFTSLTV